MQEYYFVFILPFAILLTAIILNRLNTKLLSAILIIFALTNIYSLIKNPINSDYKDKITIISEAKNYIKKNDFVLEIEGEYLYNGGWRYLFQANGLTPAQSSADELFGWIYPDEISKDKPKYKVTISRNTNLVFNNLIKKISSGIYHLFIIPNY
jgi:hypothetical protein